MNTRMMNRNPRPLYSPADDGAAPEAAPAAPAAAPDGEAAPVEAPIAEAAPDAAPAAKPTLLGGPLPSSADDPSPAAGEGADAPAEKPENDKDNAAEGEGDPEDKSGAALDVAAIKAPEGFDALDAEALAAIEPELRKLGIDTGKAQEMVDLAAKVLPDMVARAITQHEAAFASTMETEHAAWVKGCETDAEIGGNPEKLAENTAHARRFLDKFGTPALIDILEGSKLGDHVEMVRFCARAGKAMAEDSFHTQGAAAPEPRTADQVLYAPEFQPKSKR